MQPPTPTPEAGKPKGEVLEQLTTFMYLNLAVFFLKIIIFESAIVLKMLNKLLIEALSSYQ